MKEAVKKTLVVISVLLLIVANVFIFSEKALAQNEWILVCYDNECSYLGDHLCGYVYGSDGSRHECLEILITADRD